MNDTTVRIMSIELKNFKNISFGKIQMPSTFKKDLDSISSDILGIYGQNGSGKTAVIDAFSFLKTLLCGSPMPEDAYEYISKTVNQTKCIFNFLIDHKDGKWIVEYTFKLSKSEDNILSIAHEKLCTKKKDKDKWMRKKTLIEYNVFYKEHIFTPLKLWDKVTSGRKEALIDFTVNKKLAVKDRHSFIFSEDTIKTIQETFEEESELQLILKILKNYASINLFIKNNQNFGTISLDLLLPVSFKHRYEDGHLSVGEIPVLLTEPTVFPLKIFSELKSILLKNDKIIQTLIPGMKLEIKEYGEQLTKDGSEGIKFEILSVRNDNRIPIRYESEGIKKILSILNLLIAMYNNRSTCVIIDELDAGIFEYLLGELLCILEESGKGQLIFTSHNLRALEMIDKNNLVFTTANPQNRFIRIANVKSNNNLRDLYIRSINLGGQKEVIYESTDASETRRAFRKSGSVLSVKN